MTQAARRLTAEAIAGLMVDTSPYLSCDDCFARMDQHVERTVADPDYQDRAMQAHLAGCGACAEEAETLRDLLQDL